MFLLAAAAFAAEPGPFERPLALGGYALGWQGSYGAGGVGGHLRWEPFRHVGVDLFAEHLLVEGPSGLRHDHPVGFDLYAPIGLGGARVAPLLGMCAVGSFVASRSPDAPGAADVLFGAHAGLLAEAPVTPQISAFASGKAVGWVGHDRSVQGWTGSVSSTLRPFAVGQVDVGLAVHFGRG